MSCKFKTFRNNPRPNIIVLIPLTIEENMNKIHNILAVFCLVVFCACLGDKAVNSTKTAMDKSNKMAEKVVEDEKSETKNIGEVAPKEPKLREFYVEEDKSKAEPKASSSQPSTKSEKASSEENVTAKPVAKPKSKNSPKMSFASDTHAFGTIKPGDVIEHKFEFTNTGNADLVIRDAKATCGCTQPSFPFVPIAPGEKGYIGVKYDSTGKLGTQKPTVTITTNGYPKTRKVYLEGIVLSEMKKN